MKLRPHDSHMKLMPYETDATQTNLCPLKLMPHAGIWKWWDIKLRWHSVNYCCKTGNHSVRKLQEPSRFCLNFKMVGLETSQAWNCFSMKLLDLWTANAEKSVGWTCWGYYGVWNFLGWNYGSMKLNTWNYWSLIQLSALSRWAIKLVGTYQSNLYVVYTQTKLSSILRARFPMSS